MISVVWLKQLLKLWLCIHTCTCTMQVFIYIFYTSFYIFVTHNGSCINMEAAGGNINAGWKLPVSGKGITCQIWVGWPMEAADHLHVHTAHSHQAAAFTHARLAYDVTYMHMYTDILQFTITAAHRSYPCSPKFLFFKN